MQKKNRVDSTEELNLGDIIHMRFQVGVNGVVGTTAIPCFVLAKDEFYDEDNNLYDEHYILGLYPEIKKFNRNIENVDHNLSAAGESPHGVLEISTFKKCEDDSDNDGDNDPFVHHYQFEGTIPQPIKDSIDEKRFFWLMSIKNDGLDPAD